MFKSICDMYTSFDKMHSLEAKSDRFDRGNKDALEYDYVILSRNNTWSMGSFLLSGKSCHAYESIGYHAITAHLFSGWVFSGQPIYKVDDDYKVYLFNRDNLEFDLIHDNFFSWDYSLSDNDKLNKSKNLIKI